MPRECACREVVARICRWRWECLDRRELIAVVAAYRYFSIQFRENLAMARRLHPQDAKLAQLEREECDTANLSPWPAVAAPGERLDHDEFVRRLLCLSPLGRAAAARLAGLGDRYLVRVRAIAPAARASSIASYEDGGLDRVFRAVSRAPDWGDPVLRGFRHFIDRHLLFDADPAHGHGSLSRHLARDAAVLPLWDAFAAMLLAAAPGLAAPA